MATLYCSSCGTKMEYFSAKPNFCSSCGKSVNAAFASVSKSTPTKKTKLIEVSEEEDGDTQEFSGGISIPKIGVDIVVGSIEKNSLSFEELAKQKPLNMNLERKTFDPAKPLIQQMREISKPTSLGDLSSQSDE